MAQLGMAVAGAAVGFVVSGFNPAGAALGWSLGATAGMLLFPPEGPHTTGPRLNDREVQLATYGTPIPRCYGTFRVAGTLIYAKPLEEVTTDTEIGGKGGASATQTTFSYFGTFALALCQGPIAGIGRIWADGKLIYDPQGGLSVTAYPAPTVYLGTETQSADPTIQTDKGALNTPAFRGTAYLVYSRLPLINFGNRLPNITVEIYASGGATTALGSPVVAWEQPTLPTGEGTGINLDRAQSYRPISTQADKYGQTYWTSYNTEDSGLMLSRAGTVVWNYGLDELIAMGEAVGATPGLTAGAAVIVGTAVICGGEYIVGVYATTGFGTRKNVLLLTPNENAAPTPVGYCWYDSATAPPYSNIYTITQMGLGRATDPICVIGAAGILAAGVSVLPPPSDLVAARFAGGWDATTYGGTMAFSTTPYKVPALVSLYASPYANLQGDDPENGQWMTGQVVGLDVTTWLYALVNNSGTTGLESAIRWEWSLYQSYADHILHNHWTGSAFANRTLAAPTDASAALGMPWNLQHTNIDGSTFTGATPNTAFHHAVSFTPVDPAAPLNNWILLFTQTLDDGTNQAYGAAPGEVRSYVRVRAYLWSPSSGLYTFLSMATGAAWEGAKATADMADNPFALAIYEPHYSGGIYIYSTINPQMVKSTLGSASSGAPVGLAAIVSDLSLASGLTAEQIDVTGLDGVTVSGYLVGRQSTARAAIEPLMGTYLFDGFESDGKLQYRFRGSASVLTLAEAELGASSGGAEAALVTERRRQDIDLPKSITLRYISAALDYQPGTATYQRISPAYQAGDPLSSELPLVIADAEAKERAGLMLGEAWLTRTNFTFALPPSRIALDPTDVVTLTYGTGSVAVMLLKVDYGADGVVACEAHSTDAITYAAPPVESAIIAVSAQTIAAIQTVTLELLDIPLLRDQDDTPGFYVAARGTDSTWRGGAVYRAADGSTDYANFLTTPTIAVIGTTADALADGTTVVFDTANTVTVTVQAGTVLESRTELEVLAGTNIALIGDELVGFTTATQNSTTSWTLSGLLRGAQGTDHATTTHAIGDRFVLLKTNGSVLPASVSLSELGVSRNYKAVSNGGLVEDATAVPFAPTFERLKPLSPVHVAGTRDGSNNLSLTWVRRARIGGDWVDLTETPLDEPVEAYEVDVLDGVTVVRTLTTDFPAAGYLASEATADGLTPGDPVSVIVYQISTRVGRGHGRAATV